ncbi:MAG: V-type ATP synthase subunit F [Lachnospiraceae bacterium]|nr:V-type ATP synthase subunit F [Lachnospiraceae bacterium]
MDKIAVVGDIDSIYGFASIGFDTYPVESETETLSTVRKIWQDYAVIYVTEAYFGVLSEDIDKKDAPLPVITPIPGVRGNTGEGVASVKRFVEQAVGSDILFG